MSKNSNASFSNIPDPAGPVTNKTLETALASAVEYLKESNYTCAFTGAGISVESGIPPFRGSDGIWDTYDPQTLELTYFLRNPEKSWQVIRSIFYRFFNKAEPNKAHFLLARMEQEKLLQGIITQNIDNLHTQAGSKKVIEYHGTSGYLYCLECEGKTEPTAEIIAQKVPLCSCGGLYKPGFIFFGEAIPQEAAVESYEMACRCEGLIIIGSTGEVYPAAQIPKIAKNNQAIIIEINPEPSEFTAEITDIFIQAPAVFAAEKFFSLLF